MDSKESRIIMQGALDAPSDAFISYSVAVSPSFNGAPVATVLVCGWPVLVVDGEDNYAYTVLQPSDSSSDQAQSLVSLMRELGEATEETEQAYQQDMTMDNLQAVFDYADGHELVAFVGRVATAMHEAFPDETPEVTGF